MKRIIPPLLLLFAVTSVARAQNYQCLQPGAKHYFTNKNGYLRGIRIDSVKTVGSSAVYYPFHSLRGRYNPILPLDSTGGSWLGKKVIQLSDGTFLFDNLWNDTVLLKTQANIGDTWIFYNDTTSLYYQAELIATDTMSILGAVDSIKKILITAHNSLGVVSTDPVDSFQIVLSKNNGFVQVFDLYIFPYHAPDSVYANGFDYYLDHLGSPTKANSIFSLIDFINPTMAELYQWNIGDVYEYSGCNGFFEHTYPICDPVERYELYTITGASLSSGVVSYNFNDLISNYISPLPGSSGVPLFYSNSKSIGVLNYGSTPLMQTNLMPEEYGLSDFYSYFPNDTTYCITNTLFSIQHNIEIYGASYIGLFEAYDYPTLYKSPLGLLSRSSSHISISESVVQSQKLLYYSRSGSPCGQIIEPRTLINNTQMPGNVIDLYPNPAQSELTISAANKITSITISNLLGQTVYAREYNTEKVQVDVRAYRPVFI